MRHGDGDGLAFTGSTEIGKRFLVYAGESNLKRVQAETGGKSPNLILAAMDVYTELKTTWVNLGDPTRGRHG